TPGNVGSGKEPDVASSDGQEFRHIGSKSHGSAGETLSEPNRPRPTRCRRVDGLSLLRSARSGGPDARSTWSGRARHHRGIEGNPAVLIRVVLAGLYRRRDDDLIRTGFRAP